MLWNSIFEFYCKYVFGGRFAGISYNASIGNGSGYSSIYAYDIKALELSSIDGSTTYVISLGNYLSLIATIITIVAIVIFCIIIIKKIFSTCFNLFTGRSIF